MDKYGKYIIAQLNIIPQKVYVGLLAILLIGTTLVAIYRKEAFKHVAWLLLLEYSFFTLGLTVFFRKADLVRLYYTAFWSYKSIFQDGNLDVLYETILNMVLFIPIGFLWGIVSSKWSKRRQWFSVLIIGIGFSVFIEFLQYYFKKGCAEVDDVIHNTFGCLMGFLLWRSVSKLYTAIKTQSA